MSRNRDALYGPTTSKGKDYGQNAPHHAALSPVRVCFCSGAPDQDLSKPTL